MTPLEIQIKTTADLAAAQRAESALQKVVGVTKEGTAANTEAKAQLAQVSAALNSESAQAIKSKDAIDAASKATKELTGGKSQLSSAVESLTSKVPGLGVAFELIRNPYVQLTAAMVAGIKVFAEKEAAVTSLDAALANSGQMTDAYRGKLQGLADEMESATTIAETRWLKVFTTLTQAGADTSNIEKYTEAVKNLAGLPQFDGNVEGAAQAFANAMKGRTGALSRMGIIIDETKDKTKQLDDIMEQLATRGAGQLETRSKTLHGQFYLLKDAAGDLLGGFGNLLSRTGLLQGALTGLTNILSFLNGIFPPTIDKVQGLSNSLYGQTNAAKEAAQRTKDAGDETGELGSKAATAAPQIDAEAKALERVTAAIIAQRQAQDSMRDAETALALAEVDLKEAAAPQNATNKALANEARAKIKRDAENKKIQVEADRLDEDLEAEENAEKSRQLAENELKRNKQLAEAALAKKSKLAGSPDVVGKKLKSAGDLQRELDELNLALGGSAQEPYQKGGPDGKGGTLDNITGAGKRLIEGYVSVAAVSPKQRELLEQRKAEVEAAQAELPQLIPVHNELMALVKALADIDAALKKQQEKNAADRAEAAPKTQAVKDKQKELGVRGKTAGVRQTKEEIDAERERAAAAAKDLNPFDPASRKKGEDLNTKSTGPIARPVNRGPLETTSGDTRGKSVPQYPRATIPPSAHTPAASNDDYLKARAEKAQADAGKAINLLGQVLGANVMLNDTMLKTLAQFKTQLDNQQKQAENTR